MRGGRLDRRLAALAHRQRRRSGVAAVRGLSAAALPHRHRRLDHGPEQLAGRSPPVGRGVVLVRRRRVLGRARPEDDSVAEDGARREARDQWCARREAIRFLRSSAHDRHGHQALRCGRSSSYPRKRQ